MRDGDGGGSTNGLVVVPVSFHAVFNVPMARILRSDRDAIRKVGSEFVQVKYLAGDY